MTEEAKKTVTHQDIKKAMGSTPGLNEQVNKLCSDCRSNLADEDYRTVQATLQAMHYFAVGEGVQHKAWGETIQQNINQALLSRDTSAVDQAFDSHLRNLEFDYQQNCARLDQLEQSIPEAKEKEVKQKNNGDNEAKQKKHPRNEIRAQIEAIRATLTQRHTDQNTTFEDLKKQTQTGFEEKTRQRIVTAMTAAEVQRRREQGGSRSRWWQPSVIKKPYRHGKKTHIDDITSDAKKARDDKDAILIGLFQAAREPGEKGLLSAETSEFDGDLIVTFPKLASGQRAITTEGKWYNSKSSISTDQSKLDELGEVQSTVSHEGLGSASTHTRMSQCFAMLDDFAQLGKISPNATITFNNVYGIAQKQGKIINRNAQSYALRIFKYAASRGFNPENIVMHAEEGDKKPKRMGDLLTKEQYNDVKAFYKKLQQKTFDYNTPGLHKAQASDENGKFNWNAPTDSAQLDEYKRHLHNKSRKTFAQSQQVNQATRARLIAEGCSQEEMKQLLQQPEVTLAQTGGQKYSKAEYIADVLSATSFVFGEQGNASRTNILSPERLVQCIGVVADKDAVLKKLSPAATTDYYAHNLANEAKPDFAACHKVLGAQASEHYPKDNSKRGKAVCEAWADIALAMGQQCTGNTLQSMMKQLASKRDQQQFVNALCTSVDQERAAPLIQQLAKLDNGGALLEKAAENEAVRDQLAEIVLLDPQLDAKLLSIASQTNKMSRDRNNRTGMYKGKMEKLKTQYPDEKVRAAQVAARLADLIELDSDDQGVKFSANNKALRRGNKSIETNRDSLSSNEQLVLACIKEADLNNQTVLGMMHKIREYRKNPNNFPDDQKNDEDKAETAALAQAMLSIDQQLDLLVKGEKKLTKKLLPHYADRPLTAILNAADTKDISTLVSLMDSPAPADAQDEKKQADPNSGDESENDDNHERKASRSVPQQLHRVFPNLNPQVQADVINQLCKQKTFDNAVVLLAQCQNLPRTFQRVSYEHYNDILTRLLASKQITARDKARILYNKKDALSNHLHLFLPKIASTKQANDLLIELDNLGIADLMPYYNAMNDQHKPENRVLAHLSSEKSRIMFHQQTPEKAAAILDDLVSADNPEAAVDFFSQLNLVEVKAQQDEEKKKQQQEQKAKLSQSSCLEKMSPQAIGALYGQIKDSEEEQKTEDTAQTAIKYIAEAKMSLNDKAEILSQIILSNTTPRGYNKTEQKDRLARQRNWVWEYLQEDYNDEAKDANEETLFSTVFAEVAKTDHIDAGMVAAFNKCDSRTSLQLANNTRQEPNGLPIFPKQTHQDLVENKFSGSKNALIMTVQNPALAAKLIEVSHDSEQEEYDNDDDDDGLYYNNTSVILYSQFIHAHPGDTQKAAQVLTALSQVSEEEKAKNGQEDRKYAEKDDAKIEQHLLTKKLELVTHLLAKTALFYDVKAKQPVQKEEEEKQEQKVEFTAPKFDALDRYFQSVKPAIAQQVCSKLKEKNLKIIQLYKQDLQQRKNNTATKPEDAALAQEILAKLDNTQAVEQTEESSIKMRR